MKFEHYFWRVCFVLVVAMVAHGIWMGTVNSSSVCQILGLEDSLGCSQSALSGAKEDLAAASETIQENKASLENLDALTEQLSTQNTKVNNLVEILSQLNVTGAENVEGIRENNAAIREVGLWLIDYSSNLDLSE